MTLEMTMVTHIGICYNFTQGATGESVAVVLLSEGAGNPVDFRFARTVMEWRPVTSVYHRNPSGNLREEGLAYVNT